MTEIMFENQNGYLMPNHQNVEQKSFKTFD
jgi:hypothetical protein